MKPIATEWRELWRRLETFEIGGDEATLDFAGRLMRENDWPADFAARAILEYKRFLLLAVASGRPVTPSPVVDQVWHLHLVFTKSYWRELCGGVLGRELHHEPTQGGLREAARFRAQYAGTLEAYREVFGIEPPADIWPSVELRFIPEAMRWVDANRAWIIPIPTWLARISQSRGKQRLAVIGLSVILMPLALAGCWLGADNVLNWPGDAFLQLYLVLLAAAVIASFVFGRRPEGGHGVQDLEDVYEAAYLGGGPGRVLDAALAMLVGEKRLGLQGGGKREVRVHAVAEASESVEHPVERRVLAAAPTEPPVLLSTLRTVAASATNGIQARLTEAGLLMTSQERRLAMRQAALPFKLLLLIGFGKVVVGFARDKPVGWLLVLLVVTAVVGWLRSRAFGHRTRAGEQIWSRIQARRWRPLKIRNGHPDYGPREVAWAVALKGADALTLPEYWLLHHGLKRQSQTASTTGCGGGCGMLIGTGCGAGGASSGCGGGGGGCGGCGGGGGD